MFRLLLSLLFLPAIADACGFSDDENIQPGEATVEYGNRLFRGSHYNGTQLPPWVPLKIHTVFHPDVRKLAKQTRHDLDNYITTAIKRLEKMIKVRKPEKVEANPCDSTGFKREVAPEGYNFILYITVTKLPKASTRATCKFCDAEVLMVNESSRKVYHEYEAEYAKLKIPEGQNNFRGRPVSGHMKINTPQFESPRVNRQVQWIATIMHEITHAVVFSNWLFSHFINCDETTGKCQLYPDQQLQLTIPPSRPYEIPGIVEKVQRKWRLRWGEINHPVHVMTLPIVRKAAAEYFNCSEIDGIELENHGGGGVAFAHLEKRVYAHESMSAMSTAGPIAYSAITLSFFEASGWYKVDYSHADPMAYGKGKGCDFVMKSCGDFNAYPFCSDDSYTCNADHTGIEMCNAFVYDGKIPSEYDYFERPKKIPKPDDIASNTLWLSDYCPYYNLFERKNKNGDQIDSRCSSPFKSFETSLSRQTFSETARCFELKREKPSSPLTVFRKKELGIGVLQTGYAISHGCYEHKCENGQLWIMSAAGEFYPCEDGQSISVEQPSSIVGEMVAFQIQCPDCNILCGTKCADRKPSRPTEKPCRPNDKSSGLSDDPCPSTEEPEQTEEPEHPIEKTSRPADEPRTTARDDWPRDGNGYGADHHVTTIAILALLFRCLCLCLSRKRASK